MTENAGNTEDTGNTENVRNVAAKEGVCSLENAVNTENSIEMAGMEYAENTDSSSSVNPKLVLYSSDVVVTTLGSLSSENIDSFEARVMPVIPL